MNYAITPEGQIVEVGDKAVVKGYEVFSDLETLSDAIAANRTAHFKKHNPFVHAKKLWSSLPQRAGYKADLGGFQQVLQAIARLTFGAHRPKRVELSEAAKAAGVVLTKKGKAKAAAAAVGGVPKPVSKKTQIINMLAVGATREQIMAVTEWKAHSVRGFLSTLGKKTTIQTAKNEAGELVYKIG